MIDGGDFAIEIGGLKQRDNKATEAETQTIDSVGDKHGFTPREPSAPRKRGRPKSPRTGQVHAKVLPDVAKAIAAEARSKGVQQGVIIEETWRLYCEAKGL